MHQKVKNIQDDSFTITMFIIVPGNGKISQQCKYHRNIGHITRTLHTKICKNRANRFRVNCDVPYSKLTLYDTKS